MALSNSSSREETAHATENRGGDDPVLRVRTGLVGRVSGIGAEASSSAGSTPRAPASFLTVPKWGRRILPLSIPETVVGLTPASSASRPYVHIRPSRAVANLLCISLLMEPFLLPIYRNLTPY